MKTAHLFAVLSVTFLLAACKTLETPEGASQIKFGFIAAEPYHLVNFPDQAEIRICGAHFEHLKVAIAKWGAALGRTYDILQSCTNPHVNSYGPDDAFAVADCAEWGFNNRMYVHSHRNPLVMVDCAKEPERVPQSTLHEAGHLFGLCDQYPANIGKCVQSTDPVHGSVMHMAKSDDLTKDDIQGIRALAATYKVATDAGSAIILASGDYGSEASPKIWSITPEVSGSRMSGLTLGDKDGSAWSYTCSEVRTCVGETKTRIEVESSTAFSFYKENGQAYLFTKKP